MSSLSADQKNALDTQAVNNFREYLQIPSVHPDVDYGKFSINIIKNVSIIFKLF